MYAMTNTTSSIVYSKLVFSFSFVMVETKYGKNIWKSAVETVIILGPQMAITSLKQ